MRDKIGALEKGIVVFMFSYKQLTTALLFSLIEDWKMVLVSQLCGHLVSLFEISGLRVSRRQLLNTHRVTLGRKSHNRKLWHKNSEKMISLGKGISWLVVALCFSVECTGFDGSCCQQGCINTEAGIRCVCRRGFRLVNRCHCTGKL